MYYRLLLFTFFFLSGKCLFSQIPFTNARENAIANATVGCTSTYGIPTNIAALEWNKNSFISCTVSNKYFIEDLSPVSIAVSKRFNNLFSIEAALCRMGNRNFAEQFIETGISKKLGPKFSAGIKICYHQWIINESNYSNSGVFIPEAGFFVSPFQTINVGVVIRNPVRVRMNAIEQKKLPARIHSGISVKISQKVLFACSLNQQSDLPVSIRSGIEYYFHPKLIIRAGYHTQPASETFGFGLCLSRLQIDLSGETHPLLGISSSITLTYQL